MTIYLTEDFIRDAQREDFEYDWEGRTVRLTGTTFRTGLWSAELAVRDGETIVGYITPYGRDEHGAVSARLARVGVPALFRTLDHALEEIFK